MPTVNVVISSTRQGNDYRRAAMARCPKEEPCYWGLLDRVGAQVLMHVPFSKGAQQRVDMVWCAR